MNDLLDEYLKTMNFKYKNIQNYYPLFYLLTNIFERSFQKDIKFYNKKINFNFISTINIPNKLIIIKDFYKKLNIEIDQFITNNNIIILKNKENTFSSGSFWQYNNDRIIKIYNNNLVTDIPILIHEITHLINFYDNNYNITKELFSETNAYTFELFNLNYLANLGFQKDTIIFIKYLYAKLYNIAKKIRPLLKIIVSYQNKKDDYWNHLNLKNFFNKNTDIIQLCEYVLGASLIPLIYYNSLENKKYLNKVITLETNMNITVIDFLNHLELTDLDHIEEALKTFNEEILTDKIYTKKLFM